MLVESEDEKRRRSSRERSKKHYHNNLEKCRKTARESAARARADPEKRLIINARKRANGSGLDPEELDAIFIAQGCKCAICHTTEPQGLSGSKGWNVDHCHSNKVVRFILCNHCNRGLGAFRDNPEFLRRAADLLENFYDNQRKPSSETSTN